MTWPVISLIVHDMAPRMFLLMLLVYAAARFDQGATRWRWWWLVGAGAITVFVAFSWATDAIIAGAYLDGRLP